MRIIEDRLIDLFFAPSIIEKSSVNHKRYVYDELKKELEKEDPPHAKAIFDCFKFKKLEEKIKTEEPFTPPQEIIAERAKLERQETGK